MKLWLGVLVVCCLVLSGCQLSAQSSENTNTKTVPVTRVIDGDTIKVKLNGKEETVRFLLVDTPETHHPTLGVQPYGQQAAAYTKKLLEGKTIQIELAKNGGRDKYGRVLAYLFIGGKSVEKLLLEKGLARVAYVYPPNTKYLDTYRQAEKKAQDRKLNIWRVAGYVQDDGYHPEVMKSGQETAVTAPKSEKGGFAPDQNGNCHQKVKGNISQSGKIYHLPTDAYYGRTKAERCFNTVKEAEQAGFRAVK
ncbi:hypothetical protein GCM10011391_23080 [Pullulanibacillus camelliae]|uniref:TNase-like domain-containing protein n=1 Tax=Pullulanibacillus camelliae TaxID=1707096 RepID=A0A8J3DT75_9BACL|nr:thermonuclease family protein [Pullulanibacillus camelliae]GGE43677.1 hypothetical protein GCM10011391_23080 [Pullulanibacillus camelliae]